MKQLLLLPSLALLSFAGLAQTQIGNSDFEQWESVSSGEEPVNWNSFMTAQGGFSGFADVQIEPSSDTRPGSTGITSARIWSRNAGFGVTANGNMTLGKINMGAIQASSTNNYNFSDTTTADHSEAFTDMPDSIVFWVKYSPNDLQEEARMKATLHDNYPYRDPEDATASNYVVATAELNYLHTNNQWVRKAVAFDYSGPASNVAYILVTFASNAVPGGGDPDDEVLIDDIELIYNSGGSANVAEEHQYPVHVYMSNEAKTLEFKVDATTPANYEVYNMAGAQVMSGAIEPTVKFEAPSGVYIVNVATDFGVKRFKVYHQ